MRNLVRSVVAVLAATTLAAAPAAAQGFSAGAEGGVNVSDLSVDPDAETDSELGFRAGGVLRYDFAPDGMIGVHSGLTFSRKGTVAPSEGLEVDFNLDYLELPLVMAVNVPVDDSPVNPRLYAGASFNFELGCGVEAADADGESLDCDEADVFERQTVDLGLRFGGGVDIDVHQNTAVTLDVGYDLGLTDISEAESSEVKNRNLYFAAGVLFRP